MLIRNTKLRNDKRIWKYLEKMMLYFAIVIIVAFFVFPIAWEVLSSLKSTSQSTASPPLFFFKPSLAGWKYLFWEKKALYYLVNSLIVAVSTTVLSIGLATLASYGFARFYFRGRNTLLVDILSFRMLPPIAVVIPFFMIMREIRLIDTHPGLIIAHMTFNLPFAIWLMRGFFENIPVDMEEAAMVDGCSQLQAFWKIAVPLARPGIAAVSVLCFIFSWNEYMFATVLTGENVQTLPILGASVNMRYWTHWGAIASTVVFISLPVLIFALIVQKHLVEGLTLGAIKG